MSGCAVWIVSTSHVRLVKAFAVQYKSVAQDEFKCATHGCFTFVVVVGSHARPQCGISSF